MSSESRPDATVDPATDPYRPPETEPVTVESVDTSTLLRGALTGIGILLLHLVLFVLPGLGLLILFAGFTQWLVVVPLAVRWRREGRHAATRGLLIVAGIAFLLNATCTGLFWLNFQLH